MGDNGGGYVMITDRTAQDVEYAKVNYGEDLKGSYNPSDWNRVEAKVSELKDILNGYSYYVPELETKTDWTRGDFFTPETATRYLNNVKIIRDAFYVQQFTPQVPANMNKRYFDYEKANDIEKILVDIEELIYNMEQYFVKCGVCKCGQNRVWQQRFRRKYVYVPPLKTWEDLTQTTWDDFNSDEKWSDII